MPRGHFAKLRQKRRQRSRARFKLPKLIDPPLWDLAAADAHNGCGPSGFLGGLIPDWWSCGNTEINFGPACCRHDVAYGVGGREVDRRIADLQFKMNLTSTINHNIPAYRMWARWGGRQAVKLYYEAVSDSGKQYFNYTDEPPETDN